MKTITIELQLEVPDDAPEFNRKAYVWAGDNASINLQKRDDGPEMAWTNDVFGDDGFAIILTPVDTTPPLFSEGQKVKLLYVDCDTVGIITKVLDRTTDRGWMYEVDGGRFHYEHRLMDASK